MDCLGFEEFVCYLVVSSLKKKQNKNEIRITLSKYTKIQQLLIFWEHRLLSKSI